MSDLVTQAWLDQEDRHVAETIRRHGCHITAVIGCTCGRCDDGPSFAYTTGLFGLGHPELLTFGLNQQTTSGLLNELYRQVKSGSDLVPGQLLTFPDWPHRIVVEHVPNPGEIVFTANRHYDRPREASVPVLQLTWDDVGRCFPWDDGYRVPATVQPRPGTFRA